MDVGDEQIYRLRGYAPSERVRVVAIDGRKKNLRYEIEFLEGGKGGTQENVPGVRLRGPWAGAAQYDQLMADWERLNRVQLTDHEEAAVSTVFDLLIPEDTAEWEWSPVRWITRIHDRSALEPIIGISLDDLLAQADWFELDDDVILSPEGTLMVAEYACRIQPMPVLDWIAEAEVHRLDQLIVRLFDEIERHGQSMSVDYVARDNDEERITAATHTPVVDRPLRPSEVPVRYERAPRRWGV